MYNSRHSKGACAEERLGCVASRRVYWKAYMYSSKAPLPPVLRKGCVGRVASRRVDWNAYIRAVYLCRLVALSELTRPNTTNAPFRQNRGGGGGGALDECTRSSKRGATQPAF